MFAAIRPGFNISGSLEDANFADEHPHSSLFPEDFGDEYGGVADPDVVVENLWDYVVKVWLPSPVSSLVKPGGEPDYAEMAKGPYGAFKEMFGTDAQIGFRGSNGFAPDGCPTRFRRFFV